MYSIGRLFLHRLCARNGPWTLAECVVAFWGGPTCREDVSVPPVLQEVPKVQEVKRYNGSLYWLAEVPSDVRGEGSQNG